MNRESFAGIFFEVVFWKPEKRKTRRVCLCHRNRGRTVHRRSLARSISLFSPNLSPTLNTIHVRINIHSRTTSLHTRRTWFLQHLLFLERRWPYPHRHRFLPGHGKAHQTFIRLHPTYRPCPYLNRHQYPHDRMPQQRTLQMRTWRPLAMRNLSYRRPYRPGLIFHPQASRKVSLQLKEVAWKDHQKRHLCQRQKSKK